MTLYSSKREYVPSNKRFSTESSRPTSMAKAFEEDILEAQILMHKIREGLLQMPGTANTDITEIQYREALQELGLRDEEVREMVLQVFGPFNDEINPAPKSQKNVGKGKVYAKIALILSLLGGAGVYGVHNAHIAATKKQHSTDMKNIMKKVTKLEEYRMVREGQTLLILHRDSDSKFVDFIEKWEYTTMPNSTSYAVTLKEVVAPISGLDIGKESISTHQGPLGHFSVSKNPMSSFDDEKYQNLFQNAQPLSHNFRERIESDGFLSLWGLDSSELQNKSE